MSILHVKQIRSYLEANYKGYIDLSDCSDCAEKDKESAFLTRALAAYAVVNISSLTVKNVSPYITDGFKDNGIDTIYFDENIQTLYLVQSKWHHEGTGTIDRGDALKFIKGVRDIFDEDYDKFNDKVRNLSSYISSAIRSAQTKVVLLVCHTGSQNISDEIMGDFNDFMSEVNDTSEILKLISLNQEKIHKSIASNTSAIEINENVGLNHWGIINEPYKSIYGIISAEEVANWYKKYGSILFAPNIRLFLGGTEVNTNLESTIKNSPENFVYFNNGITLLCSKIEKFPVGGSKRDYGLFDCKNIAVINGAQTVGTIGKTFMESPESIKNVYLLVKIISLEGCPEGFSTLVTKAANTQNRIDSRDFVSQDEENERLKRELLIDRINYSYKRGDVISDNTVGFEFEEGIVALACANGNINYAIAAKRYVSSLWNDLTKPPYIALINRSLIGMKYWKIVQTFRIIEKCLLDMRGKQSGRRQMYLVHGNRMLEYLVFKKLFTVLDEKQFIEATMDEINKQIELILTEVYESLFSTAETQYPEAMLAFLFKNTNKCSRIAREIGL